MGQKNIVKKRFTCSESVPAFSVVAITGGTGSYRAGFTVAKPTGDDDAYAATGKAAGTSGLLSMGEELLVRYDGAVVVGDRCRPKPSDWVMEKNSAGQYVCIALYEKDGGQIAAFRKDQEAGSLKMFTAPSGGIPGRVGTLLGGATCNVIETNSVGQLTPTGTTITVYNWATSAVCAKGDRYGVAGWINAAWCVIAEDCNDTGRTIQGASSSSTVTSPSDPLQLGSPPVLGTAGSLTTVQWYGAGVGGGYG